MSKHGIAVFCVFALSVMLWIPKKSTAGPYRGSKSISADDNEDKEWGAVEEEFEVSPYEGVPDLIAVDNAVKGKKADFWGDALDDSDNVTYIFKTKEPADGPVEVTVHGRQNDKLVNYVKVEMEEEGDGPGPGGDGDAVGWAEVRDIKPGPLVLWDARNTENSDMDTDNKDPDSPTVYCPTADDGKGDVGFRLQQAAGSYPWNVMESDEQEGTITGPYAYSISDIGSGLYTLKVQAHGDFVRKIMFSVVDVNVKVTLEDVEKGGVRSGLDESTLVFKLNGSTIPEDDLDLTRTTSDNGNVLTKLVVEYTAPSEKLNLTGTNTVTVEIDDMVGNQMDVVTKTFSLP